MSSLRACSFNVRRGKGDDGRHNWKFRQRFLLETIEGIDADVIGLQEPLPHQYSFIRNELDTYDWYGVPRLGDTEGEVVAVGWDSERFDARKCETRWSSETPKEPSMSWNANWPRPVTNVQLLDWQRDGTEISVWNTHFDTGETRRRVKSAEQMNDWVAGRDPCVVMGDFNAEPDQEPIKALLSDTSLQDSRTLAESRVGPLSTGHGFEVDEEYGNCIDHVFVSESIDVTRFETVNRSDEGTYPSDHFPVVADLSIET